MQEYVSRLYGPDNFRLYKQTFLAGYGINNYHNIGTGQSPYRGKIGMGDYGPLQQASKYYARNPTGTYVNDGYEYVDVSTTYPYRGVGYTSVWNYTYPYPLDSTVSTGFRVYTRNPYERECGTCQR